ncbi:MaoC family dehydratase [Haloplasma contractile]|uniref:MaoC-like acyl dehydratase protein n=1 Tax=Haloplasma contractile SSD-17B TaxID=1033810 RepID=U2FCX7_9MOLU|nr:MaoC family dehydratase [Haloplasma contractile]ERJ10875.1 MaoC-like acyl dehydratase protein [Haloplasma contractile SSD-17B]
MVGKTLSELSLGEQASFTKTVTETDVVMFGGITGDLNPAHFNEEYAKETMFKTRIVHGCLCSSLFSTVLGVQLPGPGTIFVSQEVKYVKPVYFGDTITATVTVSDILEEKNRVICDLEATNQKGKTIIVGKAVVMPPRKNVAI